MRAVSLPQTPCYPCRPLDTDPLIRHALMASGERQGEQPLCSRSVRARTLAPLELPTPAQSRSPAVSRFVTSWRLQDRAVRHDACLAKPPPGHEQLPRHSDTPDPAQATPAVTKALLIPRRQPTLRLQAPPAPGNLKRHRADVGVAGCGHPLLVSGGATGIGGASGRSRRRLPAECETPARRSTPAHTARHYGAQSL
jgi:hypothetical protein